MNRLKWMSSWCIVWPMPNIHRMMSSIFSKLEKSLDGHVWFWLCMRCKTATEKTIAKRFPCKQTDTNGSTYFRIGEFPIRKWCKLKISCQRTRITLWNTRACVRMTFVVTGIAWTRKSVHSSSHMRRCLFSILLRSFSFIQVKSFVSMEIFSGQNNWQILNDFSVQF